MQTLILLLATMPKFTFSFARFMVQNFAQIMIQSTLMIPLALTLIGEL